MTQPADHNPWSPERYAEAAEEERAAREAGKKGDDHSPGQVVITILGVLIGIGITIYAIFLAATGG